MSQRNVGILLATLAYVLWGALVYYWHLLSHVPSLEVFGYRIIFTVISMGIYFVVTRQMGKVRLETRALVHNHRAFGLSLLASLFLGLNWLTFIYAVSINEATEASIANFIMPLVQIVLAVIFLSERLERYMWGAVGLSAVGIVVMIVADGKFPILIVIMSVCFPIYGLLKKYYTLSSDVAMLLESVVILPFVLVYLLGFASRAFWQYDPWTMLGLFFSGLVTAIPLLLFAEAVKRANYSMISFIQFINPLIALIISVLVLGEMLTIGEFWGMVFIAAAVLLFIIGQVVLLARQKG
ncbi:MAG: EamA family transporter RarD [Streptococcaceae bacterium]|jgi:chloramphenicol-sensitive protein RarD|nr:EamA family transporter RarD [Streptococcaceae bacterium]